MQSCAAKIGRQLLYQLVQMILTFKIKIWDHFFSETTFFVKEYSIIKYFYENVHFEWGV